VKSRLNSQLCESESPLAILQHTDGLIMPWIMTLFPENLRSPFVMQFSTNQSKSFHFCSRLLTLLPKFHLSGYFYQTLTEKTSRQKVDNNENWNKVVKTTVPIWTWQNKKMHEKKIKRSERHTAISVARVSVSQLILLTWKWVCRAKNIFKVPLPLLNPLDANLKFNQKSNKMLLT